MPFGVNKLGPSLLDIAAVEREVGLGKDTLRVWERRYGFPQPQRAANGVRIYPAEQVNRLRLIKCLIDQGHRPGALLKLDENALQTRLVANRAAAEAPLQAPPDLILELLLQYDASGMRAELGRRLADQGLRKFVLDTVAPLNKQVGDEWAAGKFDVSVEHLYSELVQNQLRSAIHALASTFGRPRVLLTTVRGEEHGIGLLMVEAMLLVEGASCLSLGTQTPAADISRMVAQSQADVLALSFAGSYPLNRAIEALLDLRSRVPASIKVWAGGESVARYQKPLQGVRLFSNLNQLPSALTEWRQQAASKTAES